LSPFERASFWDMHFDFWAFWILTIFVIDISELSQRVCLHANFIQLCQVSVTPPQPQWERNIFTAGWAKTSGCGVNAWRSSNFLQVGRDYKNMAFKPQSRIICICWYMYMYMHVHMHIYIYIITIVHLYIYTGGEREREGKKNVSMYVCMHVCMYVCMSVCMYAYMHAM
jgi:hypothetical protein